MMMMIIIIIIHCRIALRRPMIHCKSLKDLETSWLPLALNPEVCTCFSAVASRIPSSGSLRNRGHADLFSSARIWIRPHGELIGEGGGLVMVTFRYIQYLCGCWLPANDVNHPEYLQTCFLLTAGMPAYYCSADPHLKPYPFWFTSQVLWVKLAKPRNSCLCPPTIAGWRIQLAPKDGFRHHSSGFV